ncbi:MAG: aspartate aminotransferase family protein [Epsilonproteobacteria bacterium]|nr:aspartate aminotransferase family protein [Campylobacterota bacterium]
MNDFKFNENLYKAVDFITKEKFEKVILPQELPKKGLGENTLNIMASKVLGEATYLDSPLVFAHMDPPTPWIAWAMALWNARLNQNLLHKELSPFATQAEESVIDWIKGFFGMDGGHMCSGSSIANLTALWVARDTKNIDTIVASESSHISIDKAAKILNMKLIKVPINNDGSIDKKSVPNLKNACLVLNAGTTCSGAIDDFSLIGQAKWTHIDAAYAGALKFTSEYSNILNGIEKADSISLSAHKWLYQPKDSAIVLFKDNKKAKEVMSFGSDYLSSANIGIQGSKGANGVVLLATLLYFGKEGIDRLIAYSLKNALLFYDKLKEIEQIEVFNKPICGITLFRPKNMAVNEFLSKLPKGMFSKCKIKDKEFVRSVALNPMADIDEIVKFVNNVFK